METNLRLRKEIRLYQFYNSLPISAKLHMLIYDEYNRSMNEISKIIEEGIDSKKYKVLQDVCTDSYENMIKEISTLLDENSCSGCCEDEDDGRMLVEDKEVNCDAGNRGNPDDIDYSMSNWPSSHSDSSFEEEDDSFIFTRRAKNDI